MLSELEQRVILSLQRDLEIKPQPFLEPAAQVGVPEAEFLATVQGLMDRGYIRRFGATLRHQKSGFAANALVVWAVPEAEVKAVGQKLATYREVSHCYARRSSTSSWPYNLYSMIHGRTREDCVAIARRMAAETGLEHYELLFSETELKKTTMRYLQEDSPEDFQEEEE